MDEGYDTAFMIEVLNRLRYAHFRNPNYTPKNGEPRFIEHSAEALVIEYLKRTNRAEVVEDLQRAGRPPSYGKSRAQTIAEWRESGDEVLEYCAKILAPPSTKGLLQQNLASWVEHFIAQGMTPQKAAYEIEKISDPRIDHAQALQAWRRNTKPRD